MIRCLCGGNAYSRDELLEMCEGQDDAGDWKGLWRSMLAPGDYYCSEEDEVLSPEVARLAVAWSRPRPWWRRLVRWAR